MCVTPIILVACLLRKTRLVQQYYSRQAYRSSYNAHIKCNDGGSLELSEELEQRNGRALDALVRKLKMNWKLLKAEVIGRCRWEKVVYYDVRELPSP